MAFDGRFEWSFGNGYAGNVIIFGVDNSSSSHTDIFKNNFLVLGEGGINGILEKSFVLILVKQTQNFSWDFIIMLMIVISFLMD